jgi:hypothetical protein
MFKKLEMVLAMGKKEGREEEEIETRQLGFLFIDAFTFLK